MQQGITESIQICTEVNQYEQTNKWAGKQTVNNAMDLCITKSNEAETGVSRPARSDLDSIDSAKELI